MKNFIYIVTCMLLFTACEKNGLVDREAEASNTRIMFVHAVPEAIQFNFYVNDTKLTGAILNGALHQGMGYNTANQPPYFGYANVESGSSKIQAIVPQDYTVAANDIIYAKSSVLETSLNIEQDKSYSLFAYGTAKNINSLALNDELIKTENAAGIRFVNLMPGAVPVDLEMTYTPPGSTVATISLFATNIAYAEATDFISLNPGTYIFQRKRTGTSTLVGTATTITRLNAGQNFTLCARGTLAALLQIPHQ